MNTPNLEDRITELERRVEAQTRRIDSIIAALKSAAGQLKNIPTPDTTERDAPAGKRKQDADSNRHAGP